MLHWDASFYSFNNYFFFVILGTQQSLIAAHEALQERWEATKKNASAIGKELQMKASRWAVVEPVAMKIEKKLNIISRYIEREQNSKEKSHKYY